MSDYDGWIQRTYDFPPPIVGYIEIFHNGLFAVSKKPIWLHRFFMRLLLGWKWKEVSDE